MQEYPETVMKLSFDRLTYPEGLSSQCMETYLTYLRQNYRACAAYGPMYK